MGHGPDANAIIDAVRAALRGRPRGQARPQCHHRIAMRYGRPHVVAQMRRHRAGAHPGTMDGNGIVRAALRSRSRGQARPQRCGTGDPTWPPKHAALRGYPYPSQDSCPAPLTVLQ